MKEEGGCLQYRFDEGQAASGAGGSQPTPAYITSAQQYAGQYAQLYQQQQAAAQQQAQLYPAPPPSYEQALAHPTLNAAQAQQHPSSAWIYAGGQPVYTNYPAAAAAALNYQQQLQAAGYAAAYAPAYLPMNYQAYAAAAAAAQQQQQQQQRQTIMMSAGYDGGARFDGVSQPVVPPAPPGVAPNAAQLAAMAGHTVVLGQKKGNFLAGSSDGGYTFW